MSEALEALGRVLQEEIPLTVAMGIEPLRHDAQGLVLRAPLEPNINHKSTVFGGSLYCVAVLSGWAWLYLQMKSQDVQGHIVIHHSEISYRHPVSGDFEAHCKAPDVTQWTRFERAYQRRGRARIVLLSHIVFDGRLAVSFEGQYVVHR